jgi:hypothetical protein
VIVGMKGVKMRQPSVGGNFLIFENLALSKSVLSQKPDLTTKDTKEHKGESLNPKANCGGIAQLHANLE